MLSVTENLLFPQNFSGVDDLTTRPPLLLATVKGWRGVTEEQIHQELRTFCRFDVRRLRVNQFLLLANNFKEYVIKIQLPLNLQLSDCMGYQLMEQAADCMFTFGMDFQSWMIICQ